MILDKINSPQDLKKLSMQELVSLASELRKTIIDVVSRNGGHLASNLGVIELTIALLYVFDFPENKLIWDVGHQSYAYKILTDRKNTFKTIRKLGGLSGFSRTNESIYDAFSTGHSSTSISVANGIASAASLNNKKDKTIAVIGDGSLTGGLAYEGLNQVGLSKKNNILIVFNENNMSISPNVGSLSSMLSRKLSSTFLQNFRNQIGEFLKSLPKGNDLYQFAKRSEESFKAFVTPGMLFEAFNLDYFGPINGHNLEHLINILQNIKELKEPVLLHVRTKKGKGYVPAEKNPVYFHGISSFDVKTGNHIKKDTQKNYSDIFGETLCKLAEKDEKIIAITAAMPEGTGLACFAKKFKERFFDVGIAEQHGVTFAAAMASCGFKPVVAIYSTFLQRAYDQIVHDVCLDSYPVIFALDRAGIVGEDGSTHHGLFDLSYLRHIPNIVIMSPKNRNEFCNMLQSAFSYNCPVAIRYPRGIGASVEINQDFKEIKLGKSEIVKEGNSILILALGEMVNKAMDASNILQEEGVDACVINMRFVKPIDIETILPYAQKIKKIIIAEENSKKGGLFSAIVEELAQFGKLDYEVKQIAIEDEFIEHGKQEQLYEKYELTSLAIKELALEMLK